MKNDVLSKTLSARGVISKLLMTGVVAFGSLSAYASTVQQGQLPMTTQVGAIDNYKAKPTSFKGSLKNLKPVQVWRAGEPTEVNIRVMHPRDASLAKLPVASPVPKKADALLEKQRAVKLPAVQSLSELLNYEGQTYSGVNPPDTVGDVGKDYYIQMINASGGATVTVYDKNTGNLEANFKLEDLGQGNCASGAGDPIALYDGQAERWVLSEFSSGGNRMCVYVSSSDDPIDGGWYNYDFQAPGFPDYPKYGVWPDAYYVGTNESSPSIYAFDREAMLAGAEATMLRFTGPELNGFGFQMIIPTDLDGSELPPVGTPNYFIRHNDDESHTPNANDPQADFLEIFEFKADFANPDNASFTGPIRIPIAEIDSNLCGLTSFSCIDQPASSTNLDPLREVVMFRFSYRNFGSYEALIGNLATDVGGDQAGVRWFELRRSGDAQWSLYQEGTYAPDNVSRWMAGIAMDGSGNIAMGYNVSSASVFPGLRYVGRLSSDPLGTMGQPEQSLIEGTGANASNRFGDYSAMSVDPVDDCTFWFTGQYSIAGGQWRTRIGKFRFDSCTGSGGDNFALTGINLNQAVCKGGDFNDIELTINSVGDFSDKVNLAFSGLPAGVEASFGSNPVSVPGATVAKVEAGSLAAGSYAFSIVASAEGVADQSLPVNFDVDDVPVSFELTAPANGAQGVAGQPIFSWAEALFADRYVIEIDDNEDFSSIDITATISNGTNFIPESNLLASTTYYWRVIAQNDCGSLTSQVFTLTTAEVVDDALLVRGQPKVDLSGSQGEQLRFYIDVPDNATNLSFSIAGGSGDADLYVRQGTEPTLGDYDCRPYVSGNTESCTEASPVSGRWYVMLNGYRSFQGVSLTADYSLGLPPVVEVTTGISGSSRGDVNLSLLEVPEGASNLVIDISGDNGDADLYVNINAEPSYGQNGEYICRKVESGSNETCTFPAPSAGTYYIAIRTWNAYSDVTLTTSYSPAAN